MMHRLLQFSVAHLAIHPLFNLSPYAFVNIEDPSSIVQLVGQYDPNDSLRVLVGLTVLVGAKGTEYGGLALDNPSSPPNSPSNYLNTDWSFFGQVAWYF